MKRAALNCNHSYGFRLLAFRNAPYKSAAFTRRYVERDIESMKFKLNRDLARADR